MVSALVLIVTCTGGWRSQITVFTNSAEADRRFISIIIAASFRKSSAPCALAPLCRFGPESPESPHYPRIASIVHSVNDGPLFVYYPRLFLWVEYKDRDVRAGPQAEPPQTER